jgi:transposase InsO family protein
MAGLLGVSGGAYYRRAKYGLSTRRREADAELPRLIREIVFRHHLRYGSPRARAELRLTYGKRVSRKKAARLPRENGLNARIRRSFARTTYSNHGLPVCPNILNREFYAEPPVQKWVSDITYPRALSGWLYLTVVIDLADRTVLGWSLSGSPRTPSGRHRGWRTQTVLYGTDCYSIPAGEYRIAPRRSATPSRRCAPASVKA